MRTRFEFFVSIGCRHRQTSRPLGLSTSRPASLARTLSLSLSLSPALARTSARSPSLAFRLSRTQNQTGKTSRKKKTTGWSRPASRSAWAATTRTATCPSARGRASTGVPPSSGRRRGSWGSYWAVLVGPREEGRGDKEEEAAEEEWGRDLSSKGQQLPPFLELVKKCAFFNGLSIQMEFTNTLLLLRLFVFFL